MFVCIYAVTCFRVWYNGCGHGRENVRIFPVSTPGETGVFPHDECVFDLAASLDGAWQHGGHSSHTGTGRIIDLSTGLPIDYVVISNFCFKCQAN